MVDIATTAALVVTIIFCGDGKPVGDGCASGLPKEEHKISILSRRPDGAESLLEFDANNIPKFVLHVDGSITRAADFHMDDAALAFWRAIANIYKEACPDLSTVLDPIAKGEPK